MGSYSQDPFGAGTGWRESKAIGKDWRKTKERDKEYCNSTSSKISVREWVRFSSV